MLRPISVTWIRATGNLDPGQRGAVFEGGLLDAPKADWEVHLAQAGAPEKGQGTDGADTVGNLDFPQGRTVGEDPVLDSKDTFLDLHLDQG